MSWRRRVARLTVVVAGVDELLCLDSSVAFGGEAPYLAGLLAGGAEGEGVPDGGDGAAALSRKAYDVGGWYDDASCLDGLFHLQGDVGGGN